MVSRVTFSPNGQGQRTPLSAGSSTVIAATSFGRIEKHSFAAPTLRAPHPVGVLAP
jgi:hypothetical protein